MTFARGSSCQEIASEPAQGLVAPALLRAFQILTVALPCGWDPPLPGRQPQGVDLNIFEAAVHSYQSFGGKKEGVGLFLMDDLMKALKQPVPFLSVEFLACGFDDPIRFIIFKAYEI